MLALEDFALRLVSDRVLEFQMSSPLQDLLRKTHHENERYLHGVFGSGRQERVKELVYSHATALAELHDAVDRAPGAAFIGANRHLTTLETSRISTESFSALPDKHFFASTKKLAEELRTRSQAMLSAEDLDDVASALEIEDALRFSTQLCETLRKIRDTPDGRRASVTPLGRHDAKHAKQTEINSGIAGIAILLGGGFGFIVGGMIGLLVAGFLALLVAAGISALVTDNDHEPVVALHDELRTHTELIRSLGLTPEEILKDPQSALDKIEEFGLYAGGVILKHIQG